MLEFAVSIVKIFPGLNLSQTKKEMLIIMLILVQRPLNHVVGRLLNWNLNPVIVQPKPLSSNFCISFFA